jgi:predicted enzyme related to lactoylglutathione lyase
MTSRLVSLVLDANDPERLARFWAAALRWTIDRDSNGELALQPTDGTPFEVLFETVSEPKVGQNNIHLDLTTTSLDDQRESVEQLLALGGRQIDIGQRAEEGHVVLADPEGNELCILAPGNSFLAGAPRLGAINADGLRATGVFWSHVLGWPLVWDQQEETAVRDPGLGGPLITWSGPPLIPKHGKNRLHIDIEPLDSAEHHRELERLLALGARKVDVGQGDAPWEVLADPDGNEFCLLGRDRSLDG